MESSFCLSPWNNDTLDNEDYFKQKLKNVIKDKKCQVKHFSAQNSRVTIIKGEKMDKDSVYAKERAKRKNINVDEIEIKENSQQYPNIRSTHRSAEVTPFKKKQIKLNKVTNSKYLNLIPQSERGLDTAKDTNLILVARIIKLRKEGKLQIKESKGQRILRF